MVPDRFSGTGPCGELRLHSKYRINVPRSTVQVLLAELDPEGTQQRKAPARRQIPTLGRIIVGMPMVTINSVY